MVAKPNASAAHADASANLNAFISSPPPSPVVRHRDRSHSSGRALAAEPTNLPCLVGGWYGVRPPCLSREASHWWSRDTTRRRRTLSTPVRPLERPRPF